MVVARIPAASPMTMLTAEMLLVEASVPEMKTEGRGYMILRNHCGTRSDIPACASVLRLIGMLDSVVVSTDTAVPLAVVWFLSSIPSMVVV